MAARDVMCAALPEKYADGQPCFLVEVDQLADQSYRSLNERTLMGRSHKGVKWDRPFVVSGMLIYIFVSNSLKTLHLLEEIWGGLRERPCPKPALLSQVARLPADLPSQANKLEAAFLSAPNNATFFFSGGTFFQENDELEFKR